MLAEQAEHAEREVVPREAAPHEALPRGGLVAPPSPPAACVSHGTACVLVCSLCVLARVRVFVRACSCSRARAGARARVQVCKSTRARAGACRGVRVRAGAGACARAVLTAGGPSGLDMTKALDRGLLLSFGLGAATPVRRKEITHGT